MASGGRSRLASYVEWKRRGHGVRDINAWGGGPVNIATGDRPERVLAGRATPGFLGMLGYGHPLALGRTFVEDEGITGRDKVVILTYRLWQDRFGGDRSIVGRGVRVDESPTPSSASSARVQPIISRTRSGCRWRSPKSSSAAVAA